MVDSWNCVDRVVPEGISQVSRRPEVGNHKERTLDSRLSSGTSARTFAVSTGRYVNYRDQAEAVPKMNLTCFLYQIKKNGWKIDPHVSNLRSREFLLREVLVHTC